MITEKGTIVTEFTITGQLQKKYSRGLFITGLVSLILGCAGLIACFAVMIAVLPHENEIDIWLDVLIVFVCLIVFGGILVVSCRAQLKNAKRISGIKNIYEFYSDCIIARGIRNGEQTAVMRLDYGKMVKTKDTYDVLYFYYIVKTAAYPVDKKSLSRTELNTVKALLGCKQKVGEDVLTLPSSEGVEIQLTP